MGEFVHWLFLVGNFSDGWDPVGDRSSFRWFAGVVELALTVWVWEWGRRAGHGEGDLTIHKQFGGDFECALIQLEWF